MTIFVRMDGDLVKHKEGTEICGAFYFKPSRLPHLYRQNEVLAD